MLFNFREQPFLGLVNDVLDLPDRQAELLGEWLIANAIEQSAF